MPTTPATTMSVRMDGLGQTSRATREMCTDGMMARVCRVCVDRAHHSSTGPPLAVAELEWCRRRAIGDHGIPPALIGLGMTAQCRVAVESLPTRCNSTTAVADGAMAQCSHVRFFRTFRGAEYGPKCAVCLVAELRRRSPVCQRRSALAHGAVTPPPHRATYTARDTPPTPPPVENVAWLPVGSAPAKINCSSVSLI